MKTLLETINYLDSSEDIDGAILESINEIVDNDECETSLLEASSINPYINEYIPLIEAAINANECKKEIDQSIQDIKKEDDPKKKLKIINKLIDSLKKLINWWYKIDPEKQHRALHIVLKIAIKIAISIAILIAVHKVPFLKNATDKIATKIPVGYEGSNELFKLLYSKEAIASELVKNFIKSIVNVIQKISGDYIKYKVNEKDLDKNIETCEEMIDKLNDAISKCDDDEEIKKLMANKTYTNTCLRELRRLKKKFEKDED